MVAELDHDKSGTGSGSKLLAWCTKFRLETVLENFVPVACSKKRSESNLNRNKWYEKHLTTELQVITVPVSLQFRKSTGCCTAYLPCGPQGFLTTSPSPLDCFLPGGVRRGQHFLQNAFTKFQLLCECAICFQNVNLKT